MLEVSKPESSPRNRTARAEPDGGRQAEHVGVVGQVGREDLALEATGLEQDCHPGVGGHRPGQARFGTFSSRQVCLVDSADSSRVKVGVLFGSNLKGHRELRTTYCRYVHL